MKDTEIVENVKKWLTQTWTLNLRLDYILIWVAAWSYLVVGVHPAFRGKKILLGILALILVTRWIYRSQCIPVVLRRGHAVVFLVMLTANLLLHGADLTSDVAGDEAYHAKRAGIVLLELRNVWYNWSAMDFESYRSNYWRWFDFRHLPVVEVWRLVSLPILGGIALCILFVRRLLPAPEYVKWVCLTIACLIGAWYQAQSVNVPDHHAPFRLFPVFASTLLFGYNEFALRLPGVIIVSLLAAILYRSMWREHDGVTICLCKAVLAFLVGGAPAIFIAAQEVEASIYGMFFTFLTLFAARQYLRTRDFRYLMLCGFFTGVGVLVRQPVFALWPVVGLLFLFDRKNFHWRRILLVFYPVLLNAPYIYRLLSSKHGAVSEDRGKLDLFTEAFIGGGAFSTVLSSMSPAWLIFSLFLVGLILLGRRHTWRDLLPFISIIPVFALFFTIVPSIMGVARYQAEYIGPYLALLLLYVGEGLSPRRTWWIIPVAVYLTGVTLEFRKTATQDIRFVNPGQMQGSSAVHFPFKATLSELRRAEAHGAFAIVGGQSQYGEVPLWLSGHSFTESINCLEKSRQVKKQIAREASWTENLAFLRERNVRYLVLQEGTRRERLNQTLALKAFYQQVYEADGKDLRKIRSNVGPHGGILDIYQVRELP